MAIRIAAKRKVRAVIFQPFTLSIRLGISFLLCSIRFSKIIARHKIKIISIKFYFKICSPNKCKAFLITLDRDSFIILSKSIKSLYSYTGKYTLTPIPELLTLSLVVFSNFLLLKSINIKYIFFLRQKNLIKFYCFV